MLLPGCHPPHSLQRSPPSRLSRKATGAVAAASFSVSSPNGTQRGRIANTKQQQQQQHQQQQQQQWASNDHLWKQSIQNKHAQRRRMQLEQQSPAHGNQTTDPWPGGAAAHSGPPSQQQQQPPPDSKQQRRRRQHKAVEQLQVATDAARALTKAIGAAADVGQLLLLLTGAAQQLDAIHVSAAVNQCARGIILDLALPPQQQEQQQHQQQQQECAPGQLEWLQTLPGAAAALQHHTQHWRASQQQDPQQQQQQQQLGNLTPDWLLLLQLCTLVQQHAASMSSQQLCTCLGGFTQLLQQHPHLPLLAAPPFKAACQQLLLSAQAQMGQLAPRALSTVLHAAAGMACSRGGFSPSPAFMLSWYGASRRQLQAFSYLDLAMAAGALGRMQMFPPAEWMAAFWSRSQAALPTYPVHELLLLLLGVSSTKRPPPPAWLTAAFQHLQPSLPAMSPAQLSTAALAFGRLNYVPSTAWLSQFWQAWEAQQAVFSARGHATVMWGVGSIQPYKPDPQQWARQLQAALQVAVARATKAVAAVALQKIQLAAKKQELVHQQQLELGQPLDVPGQQLGGELGQQLAALQKQQQALAVVQEQEQQQLLVLAQQEEEPLEGEGLELLLLQQAQQQGVSEQPQLLASASLLHPTDCAMVLYGLARLGPRCLDPSFPAFWLAQSRSQLGNMNSQELATCLWALGKLRLLPPEVWLQQALQCSARAAGSMSHRQLAMVWWGCARLRYLPHVSVTAELLMCAAEQLPRFTPHSLALMVWSLGALRMRPNKEWMQLALTHASDNLWNADGMDFSGLLVGLYALGYNPGAAWLDSYLRVLANKVEVLTPTQHSRIVSVLRAFGYSAQDKPFAWVLDPVAVAGMSNRRAATAKAAVPSVVAEVAAAASSTQGGQQECLQERQRRRGRQSPAVAA